MSALRLQSVKIEHFRYQQGMTYCLTNIEITLFVKIEYLQQLQAV